LAYKVLVVDDSSFFQIRLKEIIDNHPDLTVVGVAANGQEAIDMARKLLPDVISMDYEMPFLDGVSAVRAILAERAVPIIMFSSLTYEGARITLEALEAGAVDFLPKNFADVSQRSDRLTRKLQESLLFYAREAKARAPGSFRRPETGGAAPRRHTRDVTPQAESVEKGKQPAASSAPRKSLKSHVKLLVIGASTGGPVAVTDVLTSLPAGFPLPVVVVQHMPANFTRVFAERLDRQCQLRVREAKNGDHLEPGLVLVAPGGYQLMFDRNQKNRIKVLEGDERVNYRPSVDITFASAAGVYHSHVLGVVLTGMGADGCDGARLLKAQGSVIWTQNQESCVVYGMPRAVASAGLTDEVLSPVDVGLRLAKEWTV
jgi:two-component system chemotaxis response regulator CheB